MLRLPHPRSLSLSEPFTAFASLSSLLNLKLESRLLFSFFSYSYRCGYSIPSIHILQPSAFHCLSESFSFSPISVWVFLFSFLWVKRIGTRFSPVVNSDKCCLEENKDGAKSNFLKCLIMDVLIWQVRIATFQLPCFYFPYARAALCLSRLKKTDGRTIIYKWHVKWREQGTQVPLRAAGMMDKSHGCLFLIAAVQKPGGGGDGTLSELKCLVLLFSPFDHVLFNTQGTVETLPKKSKAILWWMCGGLSQAALSVKHYVNAASGLLFAFGPIFYHVNKWRKNPDCEASRACCEAALRRSPVKLWVFQCCCTVIALLLHPHKQIMEAASVTL